MTASKVVLIIGAGPRVGAATAKKFQELGYTVVVASRSGTGAKTSEGYLSLAIDLKTPSTVVSLFGQVKEKLGAPSVVIYNAAALTPPPNDAPLAVEEAKFVADLNINTVSPYLAAQETIKGWETLSNENKKVFIYTGNILNQKTIPNSLFVTLGVGKSASSSWLDLADQCYKGKGYRFFYADQRKPDGSNMSQGVEGDAHAEFFAQLAAQDCEVPTQATFVKGKGYVGFK